MHTSVLALVVVVLGPWCPMTWILSAAKLPQTRARRVSSGGASYRGRYRVTLSFAEVDTARASLALLRRAAVHAGRWGELRQLEGAAKLLERSVEAHHRAQASEPAANDSCFGPMPEAA